MDYVPYIPGSITANTIGFSVQAGFPLVTIQCIYVSYKIGAWESSKFQTVCTPTSGWPATH